MARDVKIRFRSFLPGAGRDSAGNPKQGKTRVYGIIDVTSYAGSEGEQLRAEDIGLTNIDVITLRNEEELSGDFQPGALTRGVVYSKSNGSFYLFTQIPSTGVETGLGQTGTEVIEFVAEGDSAHDVELL